MSKLVEELKKEHVALISTLDQVRSLGIGSAEGKQLLLAAKSALLAHLGKENYELYPALRKAGQASPELQNTLQTFAKDMEVVELEAMSFFEKHQNGKHGMDFAKDFGKLVFTLNTRIRREEMVLYAEFDKLEGARN